MRILSRTDVERLLDLDDCRAAMADVMRDLSAGRAVQPLRIVETLHEGRDSALFMPALLDDPPLLGVKVVTIYPQNHVAGIASHHGALLLFESGHGRPVALMEGSSVTAIRTAAVSALATDLLARPDSRVLALLGSGIQAHSHLAALPRVRAFEEVRVWSPDPASRRRFVEGNQDCAARLTAMSTPEEAVRGADVVCTLTAAGGPIVAAGWVEAGMHINSVGASTATTRELDTATVARAGLFVDSREATLAEAGELLVPIAEGALTADHVRAELGELVAGTAAGRTDDDEVTVFNSLGLAVQDLAAAQIVFARAEAVDAGVQAPWG